MESNHHTLKTTPKDFFLHLGVMVSLYAASISLLTLLYSIINYYFPDPYVTDYYYYSYSATQINQGIAAVIVIFPLFLILARVAEKDTRTHPEKRGLWIRKWLVYLTLFAAGMAMATDLIVLIKFFLQGELTTRFLMKVLVVFLTTGGIFAYFMYDLRRDMHQKKNMLPLFASLASLVVLATLCLSFLIIGSPFEQRLYRLDETRVQDLASISQQIIYHRQNYRDVPDTLGILEQNGFPIPRDPETRADYEYRRVTDMKFELCASFSRPTRPVDVNRQARFQKPIVPGMMPEYEWDHTEGRNCFEREIFPDQIRPEPGAPTHEKIAPAL